MQDKYHRALGLVVREVSLPAFEQYVLNSHNNRTELIRLIREAEAQGLPRFNVWRMLLDLTPLNGTWEEKRAALEASRKRWASLKQQTRGSAKNPLARQSPIGKNPLGKEAAISKNPLMKNVANPLMKNLPRPERKQTDSDQFLLEEIKKDVDRTYQEMEFFREEVILKILTAVLFLWCKLNPDPSYKQGMNELLASVVYVYFQEAVPAEYEPASEYILLYCRIEQRFHELNSLAHAEADIFAVFERVMAVQKEMFKENLEGKVRGQVNPNSKNNSPILQRIIQIQDHRLKALDLDLFRILKLQDVRTKTFLLRWIRCMHTREFGLFNSLPIWDSILLDAYQSPVSRTRNQFEFVDAMCLAMFIYMRALVFTRETANQIQQIYQKYPELEGNDLRQLIALAWNVIEELRRTAGNSISVNNNANWYEDTGKSKDLGLMDKGKETVYKSKLVEKKDNEKFDDFQREENLYPDLDSKHETISPEVHKQETKIEEIVSPKHQISSSPLHHPSPSPSPQHHPNEERPHSKPIEAHKPEISPLKVKRDIIMQQSQVRGLIQSLKRSIALNDDIESRALANQVLKVLEDHLRK